MSYTRDEPLLTAANVTKRYGSVEAVSGLNFTLRDLHCSDQGRCVGQVCALLGPSGVGKTVCLRMLAGLEVPTSGTVTLDDDPKPVRAGMVGVVFQGYMLRHNRSVMSNLVVAAKLGGMKPADAETAARGYLEVFGLQNEGAKYPVELSGGMRQRVSIARSLIRMDGPNAPKMKVLLMDEPFSALDPNNTALTCQLIRKIADTGEKNTILVVTHDMRAALSVADMIYVLGRDRDANGKPCSGGKIVREMDVANCEFSWHPDSHSSAAFIQTQAELSGMFATL
jgi:NitT/TauT family transport system ATP-binding protein